jgi:hypothetical protein
MGKASSRRTETGAFSWVSAAAKQKGTSSLVRPNSYLFFDHLAISSRTNASLSTRPSPLVSASATRASIS